MKPFFDCGLILACTRVSLANMCLPSKSVFSPFVCSRSHLTADGLKTSVFVDGRLRKGPRQTQAEFSVGRRTRNSSDSFGSVTNFGATSNLKICIRKLSTFYSCKGRFNKVAVATFKLADRWTIVDSRQVLQSPAHTHTHTPSLSTHITHSKFTCSSLSLSSKISSSTWSSRAVAGDTGPEGVGRGEPVRRARARGRARHTPASA
jgi:hypothetical protein